MADRPGNNERKSVGAILGLLGGGGGGGGIGGSSSNSSAATSGAINVNTGGNSNTVMYVMLGVLGFVGLVAILIFGRKR